MTSMNNKKNTINDISNVKVLIFSISITAILTAPILFYAFNLGGHISHKNEDWGDFGSFIGGMYGSLFSFLSLIAVLYSLQLSQKNNHEQIKLIRSEQSTNEFILLLNTLNSFMTGKAYPTPFGGENDEENFTEHVFNISASNMSSDKSINKTNYHSYALNYCAETLRKRFKKSLQKEAPLFSEIIVRIKMANDTQAEAYKAIIKSYFSNDIIFLLCAQISLNGRGYNRVLLTKDLYDFPEALKNETLKQLASRP